MCMWDRGDSPSVYRACERVAKKPHKCNECSREIAVGERHRYVFMVYDGYPYTGRACAHCGVAQEWLARECGGYLWDGLWEDIRQHLEEYPALYWPLGRLYAGYRRRWCRRDGSLMMIPCVPTASVEHYVH